MSFSIRLMNYFLALMGGAEGASRLPIRSTAILRAKRMRPEDVALDWRVQVQDQCREIRQTIENNRSVGILTTEVEMLLRLLGEYEEKGQ